MDPAGLSLAGWVTAFHDSTNPVPDEDLGAAAPTLLSDGLLVGGGKDGNFYLLDPAQMDTAGSSASVIQKLLGRLKNEYSRCAKAELFAAARVRTRVQFVSPAVISSRRVV